MLQIALYEPISICQSKCPKSQYTSTNLSNFRTDRQLFTNQDLDLHGICISHALPTSTYFGLPRLTSAYLGIPRVTSAYHLGLRRPRPTSANLGQPRPTSANLGLPRPTSANLGQPRPTSANLGQPRPPGYFGLPGAMSGPVKRLRGSGYLCILRTSAH